MDFKLKLIQKYIKYTEREKVIPSVEDCVVWLIKNKSYEYKFAITLAGEYRGYINTYAISMLKQKVGRGDRNSQNYIQLLKEYKEELSENNSDNFEQVQIVFDIEDDRSVDEKVDTNETI